jgi:hypothetical protein
VPRGARQRGRTADGRARARHVEGTQRVLKQGYSKGTQRRVLKRGFSNKGARKGTQSSGETPPGACGQSRATRFRALCDGRHRRAVLLRAYRYRTQGYFGVLTAYSHGSVRDRIAVWRTPECRRSRVALWGTHRALTTRGTTRGYSLEERCTRRTCRVVYQPGGSPAAPGGALRRRGASVCASRVLRGTLRYSHASFVPRRVLHTAVEHSCPRSARTAAAVRSSYGVHILSTRLRVRRRRHQPAHARADDCRRCAPRAFDAACDAVCRVPWYRQYRTGGVPPSYPHRSFLVPPSYPRNGSASEGCAGGGPRPVLAGVLAGTRGDSRVLRGAGGREVAAEYWVGTRGYSRDRPGTGVQWLLRHG